MNLEKKKNSRIINDNKSFLPKEFAPNKTDVIIGRGKRCHKHPGNLRLKQIVLSMLDEYSAAMLQKQKSDILQLIVHQIRIYNRGDFVKQDPKTRRWFKVGDHLAKEKISKAFRDTLNRQRYSNKRYVSRDLKQQANVIMPLGLSLSKIDKPIEKMERIQYDHISTFCARDFQDETAFNLDLSHVKSPFDEEFQDAFSSDIIDDKYNMNMNSLLDSQDNDRLEFDFGEFLDIPNEKTNSELKELEVDSLQLDDELCEGSNDLEDIDIEGLEKIEDQHVPSGQEIDLDELEEIDINQIRIYHDESAFSGFNKDLFSSSLSPLPTKAKMGCKYNSQQNPTCTKFHEEYKQFFRSVTTTTQKKEPNRRKTLTARKA